MQAVLVAILLALSANSLAACGGFSSADTIADVKRKLDCWAKENEALRAEVERLQSAPPKAPELHVRLQPYLLSKMSKEECKNRALSALSARGASITKHGNYWVTAERGGRTFMMSCTDPAGAYALVSGATVDEANKDMLETLVRITYLD